VLGQRRGKADAQAALRRMQHDLQTLVAVIQVCLLGGWAGARGVLDQQASWKPCCFACLPYSKTYRDSLPIACPLFSPHCSPTLFLCPHQEPKILKERVKGLYQKYCSDAGAGG
jgi:hypothetical protein